jgi:hypothetical protein
MSGGFLNLSHVSINLSQISKSPSIGVSNQPDSTQVQGPRAHTPPKLSTFIALKVWA